MSLFIIFLIISFIVGRLFLYLYAWFKKINSKSSPEIQSVTKYVTIEKPLKKETPDNLTNTDHNGYDIYLN